MSFKEGPEDSQKGVSPEKHEGWMDFHGRRELQSDARRVDLLGDGANEVESQLLGQNKRPPRPGRQIGVLDQTQCPWVS